MGTKRTGHWASLKKSLFNRKQDVQQEVEEILEDFEQNSDNSGSPNAPSESSASDLTGEGVIDEQSQAATDNTDNFEEINLGGERYSDWDRLVSDLGLADELGLKAADETPAEPVPMAESAESFDSPQPADDTVVAESVSVDSEEPFFEESEDEDEIPQFTDLYKREQEASKTSARTSQPPKARNDKQSRDSSRDNKRNREDKPAREDKPGRDDKRRNRGKGRAQRQEDQDSLVLDTSADFMAPIHEVTIGVVSADDMPQDILNETVVARPDEVSFFGVATTVVPPVEAIGSAICSTPVPPSSGSEPVDTSDVWPAAASLLDDLIPDPPQYKKSENPESRDQSGKGGKEKPVKDKFDRKDRSDRSRQSKVKTVTERAEVSEQDLSFADNVETDKQEKFEKAEKPGRSEKKSGRYAKQDKAFGNRIADDEEAAPAPKRFGKSASAFDDELDIPRNAFDLFADEEGDADSFKAKSEPVVKSDDRSHRSDRKAIVPEPVLDIFAEDKEEDLDIPPNAFDLFADEEEAPQPAKPTCQDKREPVQDKCERQERSERPDRFDRQDRQDRSSRGRDRRRERPARVQEDSFVVETFDKPVEVAEAPVRRASSEGREARPERPARAERPERAERPAKSERPARDKYRSESSDASPFDRPEPEYRRSPRRDQPERSERRNSAFDFDEDPAMEDIRPVPRDPEAARKTINIPSWTDVMSVLVSTNLARRKSGDKSYVKRGDDRSHGNSDRDDFRRKPNGPGFDRRTFESSEETIDFSPEPGASAPRRRRRRPQE